MELGTGIFLSSALIALVLLYGFTKDRWRWRKNLGEMLGGAIVAGSVVVVVVAIGQYWEKWFPPQLGRQTQYAGLKLGMSPQEVMYIKGNPPGVFGEESTSILAGFRQQYPQYNDLSDVQLADALYKKFYSDMPREQFDKKIAAQQPKSTDKLEKDKKVTDYMAWFYKQYKYSIVVTFNDKRTALTSIICHSDDGFDHCPSIGNVSDGTSEQDALRKLGTPAEQDIDGVTKTMRFPQVGVILRLRRERVFMLEVYDPHAKPLIEITPP
jgi:hypothetical protein